MLKPVTEYNPTTEIPIVAMEVPPQKHHKWGGRYAVNVIYTDANNNQHQGRIESDKAKTLPEAIERYNKSIEQKCMFRSNGGAIIQRYMFG